MNWQTLLVTSLLIIGVGTELLCCVGILTMRNVYNRLHFTGLAALVGPITITAAVLSQEGLSQAGIKAILITLMLLIVNPILTHTTARAIYLREIAEHASGAGREQEK